MTSNDTRSPDEIMRDTEKTRAGIEENLEALERRLSPDEMLDQVNQAVAPARDGAVQFARNLGDTLRENPIPAAMVGIGIGWLLLSGRHQDSSAGGAVDRADPSRAVDEGVGETGGHARARMRDAQDWARERVGHVRERADETADSAYRRTSDTAYRAGQRLREGTAEAGNFVQRRPILTGVAVAGVGAVIAAALFARTDRGRTVVARAADAVKDTAHRAGEVVRDTGEAVGETAEAVAEAAAEAASDAVERMDEAAARAGERAGAAGEDLRRRAGEVGEKARETTQKVAPGGPGQESGESGTASPAHTRSVSEQVHAKEPEDRDPLKPAPVRPVPVTPPPFEGTESPAGAGEVHHHDADTGSEGVRPGSRPGASTAGPGAPPGTSKH